MATLSCLHVNYCCLGIAANARVPQSPEVDGRVSRSLASTSGNVLAISTSSSFHTKIPTTSKFREGRSTRAEVDGNVGLDCKKVIRARSQRGIEKLEESSSNVDRSSTAEGSPNFTLSRRSTVRSMVICVASLPYLRHDSMVIAAPLNSMEYREYVDRLDGYIFNYPSGWVQVKGAGADVFFRDPVNLDESVVVDFSSPSSSRYKSVKDLGTPKQAAERVLKQKITEFMSTRLGVRRESKIVSAKSRVGPDGRLYYDIEVDVKSYANTNQLAVMPEERVVKLEWSRRYLSTLGVENNRLYELKLQAPERVLEIEGPGLRQVMNSFQLVKLEA